MATMPEVTLCILPGYKSPHFYTNPTMIETMRMDCLKERIFKVLQITKNNIGFLQQNSTTNKTDVDFKTCLDSYIFRHEELIMDARNLFYGRKGMFEPENFRCGFFFEILFINIFFARAVSINLRLGHCFAFKFPKSRKLNGVTPDLLAFSMEEGEYLSHGWSVGIFFHSEGMFMPSFGLSYKYAGQKFAINK